MTLLLFNLGIEVGHIYQQRIGIPGVLFADPARPSHYDGIDAAHTTMAEVLQQHGYATAMFGQWHLGYQEQHNPSLHGFGDFRGFVSGNLDYQSHIDMMGRADCWHDAKLEAEDGYLTDLLTNHAVRFIEEHADRARMGGHRLRRRLGWRRSARCHRGWCNAQRPAALLERRRILLERLSRP